MLLGGFGFLSRLRGLSIDNLVEAEVVLADGSIAIVNEKEHPGTLIIPSSHTPSLRDVCAD
jgi:FAD/FMN-containing dehydrogenase